MDILLVGNYCHDTLVHSHGRYEVLGGSSSYISRALESTGVSYKVVAKVGADFRYHHDVPATPIVSSDFPTTHFVDDFTGAEGSAQLKAIGEPIYPRDLGSTRARIGLACGVAMELLPETLDELHKRCDRVICDIQALIRSADPVDGRVHLKKLSETPFGKLMDRIHVLKANAREAAFIDVPLAGDLVITEGPDGARLITGSEPDRGKETRVPAYPAREIDPTGAGDSFVAGLSLGLVSGLELVEAVRLGNRFGAFSVEAIGVPDYSRLATFVKPRLLEAVAPPLPRAKQAGRSAQ